jgi:hypothetical protein
MKKIILLCLTLSILFMGSGALASDRYRAHTYYEPQTYISTHTHISIGVPVSPFGHSYFSYSSSPHSMYRAPVRVIVREVPVRRYAPYGLRRQEWGRYERGFDRRHDRRHDRRGGDRYRR